MKSYYDIVGDGGSDIVAQVEAQQESIARSLSGVRNLVAVGSGKGGVGKSTLTMQLACALRESGHAVSILDADLNGPCQARLGTLKEWVPVPGASGVPLPRTPNGIGVVSMGSMIPEPSAGDFAILATGSTTNRGATKAFTILRELLASMDWGKLDFLLVDLPPGAERIVQYAELLGPASLFVLVTIPSDVSRGVVARSIDALSGTPNRILGYIENMAGYYCADCGRVKPLFPSSSSVTLDLPCLGSVPFDPELASICDRGGSLSESPEAFSRQPVQRIAEEVVRAVSASATRPKENS